jgi:glycosyltransferase involved in cell wall biosynthesis/SAM-dependent methyltransferase
MRLMFIASALDCGGAERHTLELANALSARGHSCDLVAMQPARDDSWARSLTDARPGDLPLRLVTLDAGHQFDGHAVRRLCTELRQRRPQVVMAINGYPLIHAARAVRAAGFAATQRPALALAFHSTRLTGVKELLQQLLVTPVARGCDQLVFVSEFQSRHWLRRGLRARRNAVIHNGVEAERFAPSVRTRWRTATRAALGFRDDDYVLGCCAQLRPEKNHEQLIDAVIALRREGVAAHALIVGEGPQRPVIERYAQAHGASAWVSLVGHQNQVERYIAAFDVGVLCSVAHETFSLAALEQMSMGVPAVLSDQGGAREMVDDGVQGFVFPTGDTPALVNALRRLHPLDARARMGAQAAEQIATRFRHADMVDRYEALFESLANGAGRPPASALSSGSVGGSERSAARIREHYLVERELASRLKAASKAERRSLYTQAYDELFRRIPDHPQITIKASPESARHEVGLQLAFIGRFLRPGQTFLEIGPGDCALSFEVCRHAARVLAVDVSTEITNVPDVPANFTLIISDGCSIPAQSNSVDVAYSNQLMEHLHPDDALEQVHNILGVLKPGGVYICITPNRITGPHDVSRGFDEEATGFHLKEYTTSELTALFREVGFTKVRSYVGARGLHLPFYPSFLAGAERLSLALPRGLRHRLLRTRILTTLLNIRMVATK